SLEFMVSVDPYCNETTRHANVILPPPSPLERSHYDMAFGTLAVRHVAKWSAPAFASGAVSESEILSRLALIAGRQGAAADPGAVDALLLDALIEAERKAPESTIAGLDPAAVKEALAGETGADRIVDFLLRTGPWGDGFGGAAGGHGLSLARLAANPHGI